MDAKWSLVYPPEKCRKVHCGGYLFLVYYPEITLDIPSL